MDEKQAIIAEMLELQHLFEKQTDEISKEIISRIKQAVDKLASKRIQGANIPPSSNRTRVFYQRRGA
jgi:DNA-binding protein H-NS